MMERRSAGRGSIRGYKVDAQEKGSQNESRSLQLPEKVKRDSLASSRRPFAEGCNLANRQHLQALRHCKSRSSAQHLQRCSSDGSQFRAIRPEHQRQRQGQDRFIQARKEGIMPASQAYIDVRGPIPVYTRGQFAIKLNGSPRDISIAEAEAIISERK